MGRHHPATFALAALLLLGCGDDSAGKPASDDAGAETGDGDSGLETGAEAGAETGPTPACAVCAIPQYSCSHTRPIESVFLTITDHSATGCSGLLHGSPIVFDCEKQEACFPDCQPFVFKGTGMTIGDMISCVQDDVRR